MAGKQSGSQKSHFGSPAGSFFCSCLGPPRCSSDRLPPRLLHNAPWKMAGRSSVFGPMPRETLLTNMSNDPGAADNDFARPVSEEKGRERGGSGRRRAAAANELRRKTDANIICRATRVRASDLGQLIRLGSFRAARGRGGSQAALDLAGEILAAVSESEPNYRSL